jgi:heat shock protein HtpX
MGLTMFLLGLVFVAFVTALVFVLIAAKVGAGAIVFFAAILGAVLVFGSLFWSDKVALRASGAQEVTPAQAPQLHGIIDRLCALADMPKPRVAIAQSDMPNAFATGRNSKNAVLVVTTGLLRRLDDRELEGVLAHEMSHVAHKDVVVMTIASFVGILAGLLVRFAFYGELFGGGRGRGGGNNNNGGALPILLIVMLVGIVTYAISFLLIRLLSRYRELAADRAGALLTGQPSALASALTKVSGAMAKIPTNDLRQAQPLNAFYFAPALKPDTTSLSTVFSTHPSLERRLQQLSEISAQLGKQ